MQWVNVKDRLPRPDWPTLLWGSRLDPEHDFAIPGCLCAYHRVFIHAHLEDESPGILRQLIGDVTHWLEWEPPS